MAERIRIGPLNRPAQGLDLEVTVDGGRVTDAVVSGTMARGLEVVLRDKDPRDAIVIAQRICGVCPAPHSVASAYAMDDIVGARVPGRARITRNLILAAAHIGSHLTGFYLSSLQDYFDPTAAASYKGKDARLRAVSTKMKRVLDSGEGAPFAPSFASPDLMRDPETSVLLLSHYLEALAMRRNADTMTAMIGGRHPHITSVVPGGVTVPVTQGQVTQFQLAAEELGDWIESVMLPDAVALATGPMSPFASGSFGSGTPNFLSFGLFDQGISGDVKDRFLPSGAILAAKGGQAVPVVQELDPAKVTESLRFAWYKDAYDGRNPSEVITEFDSSKAEAYTFVKGPRYENRPMEVGPLARMLIRRDKGFQRLIATAGVQPHSLPARMLSRAYEAQLVARKIPEWLDELVRATREEERICDDKAFPGSGRSVGLIDGPRGALGHWVSLEGGRIAGYQVVSPSTWNASPRDGSFQRGPIEEALINTPVPDSNNPINVVRVVRSFDPCLSCAVHLLDGKSRRVRVAQVW
ncbi:MAG: nickel-dependent hydrogenase large subunit [Actinobacteria bacterium]|nr:MAG: nickel-dependent hydrogenase large subunit [Actinomycetota bacterium]